MARSTVLCTFVLLSVALCALSCSLGSVRVASGGIEVCTDASLETWTLVTDEGLDSAATQARAAADTLSDDVRESLTKEAAVLLKNVSIISEANQGLLNELNVTVEEIQALMSESASLLNQSSSILNSVNNTAVEYAEVIQGLQDSLDNLVVAQAALDQRIQDAAETSSQAVDDSNTALDLANESADRLSSYGSSANLKDQQVSSRLTALSSFITTSEGRISALQERYNWLTSNITVDGILIDDMKFADIAVWDSGVFTKSIQYSSNSWTTALTESDLGNNSGYFLVAVHFRSNGYGGSIYDYRAFFLVSIYRGTNDESQILSIAPQAHAHAVNSRVIEWATRMPPGSGDDIVIIVKVNESISQPTPFSFRILQLR